MDGRFNEPTEPSSSADGGTSRRPVCQPQKLDYSSPAVQDALKHLASIDLIELCNEAKVEHCRATRELRSCGGNVKYALNSCGHAALCAECSRRCDMCPICRTPIPKDGDKLRLRLYYECVEAKLISENFNDIFDEEEDGEKQLTCDVQRLYSFFDVALDNNLVSLMCHYITDVCMDESAVSSDPVIAFLLDEVVVKDWCKRIFQNIITELRAIYNLQVEEMEASLTTLLKYSLHLAGISNVLEVLASSFKDSLSAQLHDLHNLQESILKTKQHLGIMIWCIRHQFLKRVSSRHADAGSWHSLVCERKSSAIKRAWPDAVNNFEESACQKGSLFIEDALANIETEHGYMQEAGEELGLAHVQKHGISSVLKSKIEGVAGCYPFESLRVAVDKLFLCGSSSMEVAKQAIFLYYLFDRHWTIPEEMWRPILEDFAASFSIARHLLLESKVFYLLDDHKDEALKEACRLLPEISGPTTHPKIAQVLLERGNPDAALMVLRWSGRDGASEFISLREAVTTVRVRIECGLLTEAFLHQRMLCDKVRGKKYGPSVDASVDSGEKCQSWKDWVEVLVTEICLLCIRRNMVDRMIELPWNTDEEKHIHKCLLEYATNFPSSTVGSLLVVYYIQRHRYSKANQVDVKLKNVERDFISGNSASGESISEESIGDEVLSRMRSISGWRAGLVDKCMALLPEVERLQVMAGKPLEATVTAGEVEMPAISDPTEVRDSKSTSLLIPSLKDHSVTPWPDPTFSFSEPLALETPLKRHGHFDHDPSGLGKYDSSILQERLFDNGHKAQKTPFSINKNLKYDDKSTPGRGRTSNAPPFKDLNRSSSRVIQNSNLQRNISDAISPELVNTPSSNSGLFKDFSVNLRSSVPSNGLQLDRDQRPDDSMDLSWSYERKDSIEDRVMNGGPRWRSDENSDEDEDQTPERTIRLTRRTTSARGVRRSRLAT